MKVKVVKKQYNIAAKLFCLIPNIINGNSNTNSSVSNWIRMFTFDVYLQMGLQ